MYGLCSLQVVLFVYPQSLSSSFPSLPPHIHHHHSFTHIFFFSSHYMSDDINQLSCTFFDISPNFTAALILHFLFCSALELQAYILTSSFPPHPTSSLVLSSLPKSRHRTSLLVLQLYCLTPLDPQAYSSVTQNPDAYFQFFPSRLHSIHAR